MLVLHFPHPQPVKGVRSQHLLLQLLDPPLNQTDCRCRNVHSQRQYQRSTQHSQTSCLVSCCERDGDEVDECGDAEGGLHEDEVDEACGALLRGGGERSGCAAGEA